MVPPVAYARRRPAALAVACNHVLSLMDDPKLGDVIFVPIDPWHGKSIVVTEEWLRENRPANDDVLHR